MANREFLHIDIRCKVTFGFQYRMFIIMIIHTGDTVICRTVRIIHTGDMVICRTVRIIHTGDMVICRTVRIIHTGDNHLYRYNDTSFRVLLVFIVNDVYLEPCI